jgi:hypothetical protein
VPVFAHAGLQDVLVPLSPFLLKVQFLQILILKEDTLSRLEKEPAPKPTHPFTPFAALEPRRSNLLERLMGWYENRRR